MRDDRAPAVRRQLLGLDDEVARGVVHEDVDPPETIYRRGDEGVHLLGVANVGRLPQRLPALALDQADGLVQRLRPPACDDDAGPEARELEREGAAEAAAPAGDERDLPFEGSLSEHRRHSPRSERGHRGQALRRGSRAAG